MTLLFIIIILFCLLYRRYNSYEAFVIIVLLVCIAIFRRDSLPDYNVYLLFKLHYFDDERFEPSIYHIRYISDLISNSYYIFFLIYALLAISIKLYALRRLSNLFYLSLLFYIAMDFPIHEMIQMRAAVSMSLLLCSLPSLYKRNLFQYSIFTAIAIYFHYSAALMIPLYFLDVGRINKTICISLMGISYLLGALGIGFSYIFNLIPLQEVQTLINMYQSYTMDSNALLSTEKINN